MDLGGLVRLFVLSFVCQCVKWEIEKRLDEIERRKARDNCVRHLCVQLALLRRVEVSAEYLSQEAEALSSNGVIHKLEYSATTNRSPVKSVGKRYFSPVMTDMIATANAAISSCRSIFEPACTDLNFSVLWNVSSNFGASWKEKLKEVSEGKKESSVGPSKGSPSDPSSATADILNSVNELSFQLIPVPNVRNC